MELVKKLWIFVVALSLSLVSHVHAQVAFPDLFVESVTFDQYTLTPTITVTNKGDVDANLGSDPNSWVYLTYQWLDNTGNALSAVVRLDTHLKGFGPGMGPGDFLSPGETVRATIYRPSPPLTARYFKVTVDDPNHVRESDENNTKTISIPTPKLPDLRVSAVTFDPYNRNPTITITNLGEADANLGVSSDTWVNLYYAWLTAGGEVIKDGTMGNIRGFGPGYGPGDFLSPGETATTTFDRLDPPLTAIHFRVIIDQSNHVVESNEENNWRQFYLDPPKLPDLVIDSVTFDPYTRIPSITIANKGEADANLGVSANTWVAMSYAWLTAGGQVIKEIKDENIRGFGPGMGPGDFLSPGETATKTYDRFVVPRETIHFRVTIDPDNHVMESDEDHNTRQFYLDPPRLPDLVVSSVTFDAQGIPTIAITNNGQADATLGVGSNEFVYVTYLWLDANKAPLGETVRLDHLRGFQPLGKDALSPGETVTATVYRPPHPELARFLTVTVDNPDRVWESNEGNNVLTQELPASLLPDLTVERITFDNGKPQVFIKNIGKSAVDLGTTPDTSVILTVGWKDAQGNTIPPVEQLEVRKFTSQRFLTPGASLLLKATTSPPPGAIASWGFIDNPDRVKESNECNNELIALIVSQETSAEDMTAFDQKLLVDRIRKGNPCVRTTSTGIRIPSITFPSIIPVDVLSDFGRNIRLVLTFDSTKKVELRQQFAGEKLLEAAVLINDKKDQQANLRLRSYGNDVQTILQQLATLKEAKPSGYAPLATMVIEHDILHLAFIETLDKKLPVGTKENVRAQRDKLLEAFGVLAPTMDAKTVSQALSRSLDENGSPLRGVQNITILDMLKPHTSGTVKQAIETFKQKENDYVQGNIRVVPPGQQTEQLPPTVDWQNLFPPETLKELEQSVGPLIEQIKKLCGTVPQTDAEAQECAQKILGGSFTIPQEESIDEGIYE